MKTKDIYDVFGIAPSTLSDWSKEDNKKHTLAKLLKNISMNEVKDILLKELKSQSKPVSSTILVFSSSLKSSSALASSISKTQDAICNALLSSSTLDLLFLLANNSLKKLSIKYSLFFFYSGKNSSGVLLINYFFFYWWSFIKNS